MTSGSWAGRPVLPIPVGGARRAVVEPAVLAGLVITGAGAAGLLAGSDTTTFGLLLGVSVVAGVCFVGPRCRLTVAVLGALVVFQSELTSLKYAYLGLVILCFALSLPSLVSTGRLDARYRPLVLGASAFAAYLVFTCLVAVSNGTGPGVWFRDALSYLLLLMLPFVGIAAGARVTGRDSRWALALLGVVCGVGLATDWMDRRGVSALPFGRLLLSSTVLVALCFAFAITVASLPRRTWGDRLLMGTAAGLIVISLLLTGSRTNLVLLVAFLGILGAARRGAVPAWRALMLLLGLAAGLALIAPVATRLLIADPSFLPSRLEDATRVLSGQASDDQSFELRSLSYQWVAESFARHPVLGTGPGYQYQLPDIPTIKTATLDAPAITLAKFGLLGTAVLVGFLACLAVTYRRVRRGHPVTPMSVAARGWLLALLILVPFGALLEDKGLSLALAILLAVAIGEIRRLSETPPAEVAASGPRRTP